MREGEGDADGTGGRLNGKPSLSLPETYSCASRATWTFARTTDSALRANLCSIAAHKASMLNPMTPMAAPSATMFIDALLPAFSAMFTIGTDRTRMSDLGSSSGHGFVADQGAARAKLPSWVRAASRVRVAMT